MVALVFAGLVAFSAWSSELIKFNYKNADVTQVVDDYSKFTGQTFIIDPEVKGRITILNPQPINAEEAFSQLSTALSANSLAISTQGPVNLVTHSRSVQRNYIPVVTEAPPLRPERMYTMIVQLKNASADEINKQLRILVSRDGELVPYTPTNQMIISDWSSNLNRVAALIKEIDKPVAAKKR